MKRAAQKGAQIIEFAFALPFLILLLFIIIDFGFLVYNKAIITNAAREAVRRGTVLTADDWNPSNIQKVACDQVRSIVITVSNGTKTDTCTGTADPIITVTPQAPAPAFNDPVTVDISYSFTGFVIGRVWQLGTTGPVVTDAINLTASVEMLHE